MCTVTLVPLGPADRARGSDPAAGFRLACNRDEARTRMEALPPQPLPCGRRTALAPRDGDKGGTWIAVSDAGLAMVLLNRRIAPVREKARVAEPADAASSGRPSRGWIIPALLPSENLREAIDRAHDLLAGGFAPFHLVLTDGREVDEIRSDGARPDHRREPWSGEPLLFTSSGLGDALVDGPRRDLFRSMVAVGGAPDLAERQDRFHRHSWPDRPHLSVCMRREDACTVSHSVIEVLPDEAARFLYYSGPPDASVAPTIARLPMRPASASPS